MVPTANHKTKEQLKIVALGYFPPAKNQNDKTLYPVHLVLVQLPRDKMYRLNTALLKRWH